MQKKTLLQELTESGVDFDTRPASYFSGGIDDQCHIDPCNIIVFFSPLLRGKKMNKYYHQRYQIKCAMVTTFETSPMRPPSKVVFYIPFP